MEPYRGIDLLGLEAQLSDDERQVRDTVRDWVEREAIPAVVPHFREATFPSELIRPMAELGIFGAHIDGYGCAGVSPVAYGLIMQELERADSGFRSFASVQSSLAMTAIHDFGSEEHRERYLPEMAAGRLLGAFALTEADHGSDPAGMETRAEAVADGYRLKRINEAEGDVARFSALLAEYTKAPEVTRRRIYIETLQDVLPSIRSKIIVDAQIRSILPMLNLDSQMGERP